MTRGDVAEALVLLRVGDVRRSWSPAGAPSPDSRPGMPGVTQLTVKSPEQGLTL